jgi:hypothetical protein
MWMKILKKKYLKGETLAQAQNKKRGLTLLVQADGR